MKIRFYEDPETGLPHCYDHGVTEEEVQEILNHAGEERRGTEDSWVATGQTRSGRYLRVIYSRDPEPGSIFVITAYDLIGKSRKAYRRRKRKKR